MEIASCNIREARKEDMQQIYEMIIALAKFENMENQVKITPETLIADAFAPNPAFHCFVATNVENEAKIIGYALFYNCYSTWLGKSIFLEDLYVDAGFRKRGIGKQLFLKVAERAHETSNRMDFHVLSWNPAKEFYKKLGCVNLAKLEEWELYRLESKALNKLFER